MKKLSLIFVFLSIVCFAKDFIRPVEISGNVKTRRENSVVMKKQPLEKWRIESKNVSNVSLTLSGEAPLWEDKVAKLSFSVNDIKQPTVISLYPTEKMQIPDGNMIEFWVNGPSLFHAYMTAYFRSADNVTSRMAVVGGSHQWNLTSYWGTALTVGRPRGKAPWRLTQLELTIKPYEAPKAGKEVAIYFDEFAALNRKFNPNESALKWRDEYPKPTTPYTMLPSVKGEAPAVALKKDGKAYYFTSGKAPNYRYTPKTGTLSDLEVQAEPDGEWFKVTQNGGPKAEVDGVVIAPDDDSVQATLLSCKMAGNILRTAWVRSKNGVGFTYKMDFEIRQKTLIMTINGDEPVVPVFIAGNTENTPGLKVLDVSFYNHRHARPHIGYFKGHFISCIMDWYTTNGNMVFDDGPDMKRVIGPATVGKDQERLTGGSDYRKLSDGSRNLLSDRLFITVSDDIDEVLPNIPNPPSPYLAETSKRIYCSHANYLTDKSEAEKTLAFWTLLHAYGLNDIAIRWHMEVFGTPLESNRLARENDAYAGLGDDALRKLIDGLHSLGYVVSGYQNDTVMHGLSPEYDVNKICLDYNFYPSQRWKFSNYLPRPWWQVQHVVDFLPAYKQKWGFDGIYDDEISNNTPYVDYEAGVPGAGKLTEFLYGNMLALKKAREIMQGPIWSEGTAQMFRAGYTDLNYAQCNYPQLPVIPNFQLNKLHLLQNDIGSDLAAFSRKWTLDYWLATTIVFGNVGSLCVPDEYGAMLHGSPDRFRNYGKLAKSYFMMRALQELYSRQPPVEILYSDPKGALISINKAIELGTINYNRIYTRYANGLEVWVNRNEGHSWDIDFNGEKLTLPPCGYAARLDGKILEYSAGKQRSDYVESELYCYADGRGVRTDFPKITAAGAYMWQRRDGGIRLIPQHGNQPETIVLKGIGKVAEIIPMDMHGKPLNEKADYKSNGDNLEIEITPAAFQYQIQTQN